VFLEQLETNPARFLPEVDEQRLAGEVVKIDLRSRWPKIRADAEQVPDQDALLAERADGRRARHRARAQLKERLDARPGTAAVPEGPRRLLRGSGEDAGRHGVGLVRADDRGPHGQPTSTRSRRAGGSFVMLAKGNRSKAVTDACKKHTGFYLGSIGGPAAILAQDSITKVECSTRRSGHGVGVEDRGEGLPGSRSSSSTTRATTSSRLQGCARRARTSWVVDPAPQAPSPPIRRRRGGGRVSRPMRGRLALPRPQGPARALDRGFGCGLMPALSLLQDEDGELGHLHAELVGLDGRG
jgi:hypothetical protein